MYLDTVRFARTEDNPGRAGTEKSVLVSSSSVCFRLTFIMLCDNFFPSFFALDCFFSLVSQGSF